MKSLFLMGLMLAVGSVSAFGALITYSTISSQVCVGAAGCGVGTQTIGGGAGVTVTFDPVFNLTVNAAPTTFDSLGVLRISCVGGGTACGSQSLAGVNLYINILQSAPSAGFGNFSGGVLAGSLSGTASSASITWAVPNTISIGAVQYTILNNPLGLLPPSVQGGSSEIRAIIQDNSVPEPSTLVVVGSGILLAGLLRRKK